MEEVVRTRLKIVGESVQSLLTSGQRMITELKANGVSVEESRIVATKLKSANECLATEIHNYCKLVENPSAEEVTRLTNTQLKAGEIVAEIEVLTQNKLDSSHTMGETRPNRLPRMELARFDGDVLKWHQFWDQFGSNVDGRNISAVDKLLYLQSVLDGEAKQTIDGLDTTSKNYEIAIETLKERYGKTDSIIDAHYVALYRIKAADPNIKSCRGVFNDIERHLRVLKSLGENVDHNHLRVMIMEKFPEDIIYELRLKLEKDETIENIRKGLELIISAREISNRMKRESKEKPDKSDTADNGTYTVGTLFSTSVPKVNFKRKRHFEKRENSSQGNKRAKRSCIFCDKNHYNDECSMNLKERKEKIKSTNKCFLCFRDGHRASKCFIKRRCVYCKRNHNRALCPSKNSQMKDQDRTSAVPPDAAATISMVSSNNQPIIVLQTATANIRKVEGDSKFVTCRTLLDCGSQRSYVSSRTVKALNIPSLEDNYLIVYTFGTNTPKEFYSPIVNIHIETRTNNNKVIQANVIDTITEKVAEIQKPILQLIPSHVRSSITIADDNTVGDKIDLLIGNDYYYSFIRNEKIRLHEDLYIVNTDFGWIFAGKFQDSKEIEHTMSVITYAEEVTHCQTNNYVTPDPPLREDNIKKLWDLETIGITDSPKTKRDDEAIENFNQTVHFQGKRYYIKWPWIEYPPDLPDNLGLAYGRLRNLIKRTDKDVLKMYDDTISEQLRLGIIEEAPTLSQDMNHPVHYLPHHCIIQEGKTTKLRVVYDASARIKEHSSLNQCLYRGPSMLEDLTAILLRFRRYKYGVTGDVEKAFLQVGLQEEDRDVTRFLWLRDLNDEADGDNIKHLRFCRVPFGIISSPFILAATINFHLQKSDNNVAKLITNNIYVDNLVTCLSTPEEVVQLHNEAKTLFNELSMNIREWHSNCEELMSYLQETDPNKIVNVLGMSWNSEKDTLSIKTDIQKLLEVKVDTKRHILQIMASIYDPCGFIAPLLLSTKLFLQDLWRLKYKWDTQLTDELKDSWSTIATAYQEIKRFEIPRCLLEDKQQNYASNTRYELHCFSDSSMLAYTAVVYLRAVKEENVKVSFVMSKTRLKSLKEKDDLKIPKLELLGALIGCRLLLYIKKMLQMDIEKEILWTDSTVVLSWMKTDKLLPPFVARRINEMRENKSLQMKYVPSKENPADIGTRPLKCALEESIWTSGPTFLAQMDTTWPSDIPDPITTSNVVAAEGLPSTSKESGISETEQSQENTVENTSLAGSEEESEKGNRENFASEIESTNTGNESQMKEIEHEEMMKIIELQKTYFQNEYNGRNTDLLKSLQLFKDEKGMLRCQGRFQNTDWLNNKKYPILLPRNTDYTLDLISRIHRDNYHVGASHTLALLRENYWVPKGRSQVQKAINRCPQCRKHGGGPFKLPPMPPLPEERSSYCPAFSYSGIDYLGPVMTTNNEKRWICLFTCLSVRAVHMEVVHSLSAEECLLALRRFVSTRGLPLQVTSDNALYFKLLAEVMVSKYCIENKVKWKFIPELAPWFGGFYERLVGLVKHCMKRTLEKHLLSDQQLVTVIKEIEGVLNSRPLTYVGSELDHVLTPADFLRLGGPLVMSSADAEVLEPVTETKERLIEGWKRGQKILQEFMIMFRNQYLPSLRERRNLHKEPRVKSDRVPKIGELVQIKAEGSRVNWKVGKIKELVTSGDGYIRVARVETRPGELLTRSISHLYPLELEDSGLRDVTEKGDSSQSQRVDRECPQTESESDRATEPSRLPRDVTDQKEMRPKRSSAAKARQLLKIWTAQLIARQQ